MYVSAHCLPYHPPPIVIALPGKLLQSSAPEIHLGKIPSTNHQLWWRSCWKSSSNICSYPRNRRCLINCHYPRGFTLWNMSVIPRSHTGDVHKLFPRIFSVVHDLKCRLPITSKNWLMGTDQNWVPKVGWFTKIGWTSIPSGLEFWPIPNWTFIPPKMEDDWGFPLVVNMACCKIHHLQSFSHEFLHL